VGNAGGPEEWKDDCFVHKGLEVKEYLVKAKAQRTVARLELILWGNPELRSVGVNPG